MLAPKMGRSTMVHSFHYREELMQNKYGLFVYFACGFCFPCQAAAVVDYIGPAVGLSYLPCLWILFPSKVGLVLVIWIYVYAFVGSFRNTWALYPDVECVCLLYTCGDRTTLGDLMRFVIYLVCGVCIPTRLILVAANENHICEFQFGWVKLWQS